MCMSLCAEGHWKGERVGVGGRALLVIGPGLEYRGRFIRRL